MNKKLFAVGFICSFAGFAAAFVLFAGAGKPSPPLITERPLGHEAGVTLTDNGNTLKFTEFMVENVLATKKDLPQLFLEEWLVRNDNVFYTYNFIDDTGSDTQFLRVDKMVIQTGNHWYNNATALFRYNFEEQRYEPVLVSSPEQNAARFPQTEIISQGPLTLKFYYDVARPSFCHGPGCRVYWMDYYRYDREKGGFLSMNSEYREFYREILDGYEHLNRLGCGLGNVEGESKLSHEAPLKEVYNSSETNYCHGSSREELGKFMSYWQKVKNVAK